MQKQPRILCAKPFSRAGFNRAAIYDWSPQEVIDAAASLHPHRLQRISKGREKTSGTGTGTLQGAEVATSDLMSGGH